MFMLLKSLLFNFSCENFNIINQSYIIKMDMPQDTPTKQVKRQQQKEQEQYNSDQQENFSSFQSNHKPLQQRSNSNDENGFRNMHTYKQKQVSFPQEHSQLGRLYNIYSQNVNRKKELKRSIQELIQFQILSLRINDAKQNSTIQQFIDLQQKSKEYQVSRENYVKRKEQLEQLARKYRQLKINQVQTMIIMNQDMKQTLNRYVQKYKKIINTYVIEDTVGVLCEEKYKNKKLGKMKMKIDKKMQKKLLSGNSNKSQQQIEDGAKSRNASQTVSQDQQQPKLQQKYTLRNIKFYKSESQICFEPLQQHMELPSGKHYKGILFSIIHKNYIVYQQNCIYIMKQNGKDLKIVYEKKIDKPIIYCQIMKNNLYVCTSDGVLRLYQMRQGKQLVLLKCILCSNGKSGIITHCAITSNPDIVLFVKQGVHLCEMNLSTYTSHLLSHLPEQVEKIDQKMILSKNMSYINYYIATATHGKVILQHNDKVQESRKGKKIIKFHKYQKNQYFIYDESNGLFSISGLAQKPNKL